MDSWTVIERFHQRGSNLVPDACRGAETSRGQTIELSAGRKSAWTRKNTYMNIYENGHTQIQISKEPPPAAAWRRTIRDAPAVGRAAP